MSKKLPPLLFLAVVCLAGATLADYDASSCPAITDFYPEETNISDTEGSAREFSVTINQAADVRWLMDGTEVGNEPGVNHSTYQNASAARGYWNVTVEVGNENGSDTRHWLWTVSNTPVPVAIIGYVVYTDGSPVPNPSVNITNLNTYEDFSVAKNASWNYYRAMTSSAHLHPGDRIRFNASSGAKWNETIRNVTAEDITGGSGLFMQNLTFETETPDLVINCSNVADPENKTLYVIYTVENIGDRDANASTTTIYLDGIPVRADSVRSLAPGENYTGTVGPFDFPINSRIIVVCADDAGVVDEFYEDNNCAEVAVNCSLPDLDVYEYIEYIPGAPAGGSPARKLPLIHALDLPNGRYEICYRIFNKNRNATIPSSNVTINITTVATNGSVVSTEIINHSIPGPAREWWEDYYNNEYSTNNISQTFTCVPNTTLVVTVCADSDHEHLEINETDNCKKAEYVCQCVWKPDLKLIDHNETWIDKTNRTFTIAYTVENIGNVAANASTTRITKSEVWGTGTVNTTFDQVPVIAPGERCTSTITSQGLLYGNPPHPPVAVLIKIDADYNDTISESIENNNGVSYRFGFPYLTFWQGMRYWGANRTFSIEYTVQNVWFAGARSQPTTLYADINGNRSDVTSIIPSYDIDKGTDRPHLYTGWFQAPLDVHPANVTYRLCWDRGDGVESCTADAILGCGACVADDGTRFDSCGERLGHGAGHYNHMRVSKSCTFESDILSPPGMEIMAHNIVIDGNGSGLVGTGGDTGIKGRGHSNLTLQNIDISGFGSAVTIGGSWNQIENCLIHDNARISLTSAEHVKIGNCSIYNDTDGSGISLAGGCYCDIINCSIYNTGGYGILFQDHYDYNYCNVTNSSIYNNNISGIRAPTTVSHLVIRNNLIADNGYYGIGKFCSGIKLHWKGGYGSRSNATVESNVIRNNTGEGIYTAHGYPTIRDNIITGCKKNESDLDVTGCGILVDKGWMTFLHNNTICDNEGADIADIPRGDGKSTTFGDDNTCGYGATDCYDDEGTAGCTFYCDGISGVCIAEDGTTFVCGDVVTKSCTLNRSMDCRNCSCDCDCDCDCDCGCCGCDGLVAGADDIVINGSNYTITGNLTGTGIVSRHKNVTIMNLQTKDFATGILVENTVDNTICGCNLRRNRLTGVNITADNCTVSESRVYDNLGPGIAVFGDYNRFTNNTAAQNRNGTLLSGYGFYFGSDATGNTITGNAVGDNEDVDIHDVSGNGTSEASDNNTCDDPIHNYWDLSMSPEKTYGCVYPWTPPDLIISKIYKPPVWINKADKTYKVKYTIKNIGKPTSREAYPSISWLRIGYFHKAEDPVGSLLPDESSDERFDYTVTMSGDKDTVTVCADGPDEIMEANDANKFYRNTVGCYTVEDFFSGDEETRNCESETFEYEADDEQHECGGVCMCKNDWCDNVGRPYYVCGDTVTESCEFNGTMCCPAGSCGLRIGASAIEITIDGNGHALIGDVTLGDCSDGAEENPCEASGIYNSGYDTVEIKDLTIKGFCSGIVIMDADSNTVKGCDIYDNGFDHGDSVTHGIHLNIISDVEIHDNKIHDNKGTGAGCTGGGNGIFVRAGSNSHGFVFSDNHLYNNDKTGILCKKGMTGAQITGNEVYKNGDSELGMTAGIRLQCISSDDNDIIGNTVYKNYAEGIFINSNDNTIDSNTVCDNERTDIFISSPINGNHGSDNTCDTTRNFVCELPCTNPDLTISHISEDWSDLAKLEYKITYTVENVGLGGANASEVRICIDGDDCTNYPVPPLNASSTNTSTVGPFTLSDNLVDEIIICVDPDELIEEVEEDFGSNCIENIWYAKPDLTVTAFDVPGAGNLTLFTDSTANATIENIGTISAKGFNVTLYVEGKEESIPVSELAPGESVTLSFTWFVGASNLLRVFADSGEEIDEWREDNNDASERRSLTSGPKETETPGSPGIYDPNAPENPDTEIDLDDVTPGGGVDYDMDELGGNGSASGRVSKERVSAQLFRSTPFLSNVSDIVVSYNGLAVLGAVFIAALFLIGYRGEIRMHRRNNR